MGKNFIIKVIFVLVMLGAWVYLFSRCLGVSLYMFPEGNGMVGGVIFTWHFSKGLLLRVILTFLAASAIIGGAFSLFIFLKDKAIEKIKERFGKK